VALGGRGDIRIIPTKLTFANVVSVIALFIALGGAGYAVTTLPKKSVGARQLKKGAVTPPKVAPATVELFRGQQGPPGQQGPQGQQGPPGPTFGETAVGPNSPTDPPVSPDESAATATVNGRHFDFTLPAAGGTYIRFYTPFWGANCSAGNPRAGLYLNGAPLRNTSQVIPQVAVANTQEFVSLIPLGAGAHSVELRKDCPGGSPSGGVDSNSGVWTVFLLGG
jgi:hypothetical protein